MLSLYGTYILAAFAKGQCYLWRDGLECKFCSLNPTRRVLLDGVMHLNARCVAEAATLAFRTDSEQIACVMYCGGSIPDRDREVRDYAELARATNAASIDHDVHHHLLTMPPRSHGIFQELLDAGIDDIGMSLEVFDPGLFKAVCPGKARFVGYDGYFRAFEAAVKVFGRGRVYCVFVGGMEEERTMFQGFDTLAAMGVVPSVNVFHPDPGSQMVHRRAPDIEYVLDVVRYLGGIYRRYGFLPAVCGFNRSSLDAEGAAGFFDATVESPESLLGRRPGRQPIRRINDAPSHFKPTRFEPELTYD